MNKSKMLNYMHPFHLVTLSPWPIFTSLSLMIMMSGIIQWMNEYNNNLLLIGLTLVLLNAFQWWRDIIRESTFQGNHTIMVMKLLQMGMMLFIISELFFFISFFWSFFHSSLSPSIEIGMMWPPKSIIMFNPFSIPLLNTIILLTSGITITWCHYSILYNNFSDSKLSLLLTMLLGIYFSLLQLMEYIEAMFTISDSIFGSTFFMITGFHGIHVIVGTIFIMNMFKRLMNYQFSSYHHFGFEASSWYWHFVDVIWLFVYILLYWWTY